jgi:hypothetical protein
MSLRIKFGHLVLYNRITKIGLQYLEVNIGEFGKSVIVNVLRQIVLVVQMRNVANNFDNVTLAVSRSPVCKE